MTGTDVIALAKDAGTWIGLVGGLAGLYTFAASLWRRRLRISVDHSEGNDAHDSWHRFVITNRSDLTLTFRYIGPAWFLTTPLGRQMLNFAFDTEDADPQLTVLGPHSSVQWDMDDEHWQLAVPAERRAAAYLRVGIEVPRLGTLRWIKPRSARNWDLSLRERLIHRLYGLWGGGTL